MKEGDTSPPEALVRTLDSWNRFVCVGHVTPDADCLGAMFAVARTWTARGADVMVSLPTESLSNRLAFMTERTDIRTATARDFAEADGFFVADTARMSRCNVADAHRAVFPGGRPVLCVDHHVSNTGFGDVNWTVDHAASTCELVLRLLQSANLPIDAVTASLLYAGIYTDTAGFSLPTTSAETFQAAADLARAGADIAGIGANLRRSRSTSDFALQRLIFANTHLAADGRISYSVANHADIIGAGCTAADIDEQVNIPRSLSGIKVAILFTEGDKGRTRINFRGEEGTDVLDLARRFGGGGHRGAAGAVLNCPAEEAVARVLPVAVEMLDGLQPRSCGERSASNT